MTDPTDTLPTLARATMQDVAKAAGVSLKSVSRVINQEPHVSPRLRDKVQAAIDALHYVPDIAARSLAGQRSFALGVLLDNPSPHYTMQLVSGAYQACREHRYTLQFDNLNDETGCLDPAERIADVLRVSRLDGMILTPPTSDMPEVLAMLERHAMPYVRIGPVDAPERAPAVFMDDRAAARDIADHFWDMGHRRFGVVRGLRSHASSILRHEGFLERLRELNRDVTVIEVEGDYTFDGGFRAGLELFAARRPPTAVFAANDDTAAGVLIAASRQELKVPRDVSVIGFDDSWIAKSVWPNLTTIRQPTEAMGYAAAQMLIARETRKGKGFAQRKLGHELVVRDTVADVR